jgi:hypothetical protein
MDEIITFEEQTSSNSRRSSTKLSVILGLFGKLARPAR